MSDVRVVCPRTGLDSTVPARTPEPRRSAYVALRDRIVLLRGQSGTVEADGRTWRWEWSRQQADFVLRETS